MRLITAGEAANQAADMAADTSLDYTLGGSFRRLDDLTGGLHRARMHIVAARPGQGKSTLVACWAVNLAAQGLRVLYVTIEMEPGEVFYRLGRGIGRVTKKDLRADGDRGTLAWADYQGALDFLADLPIDFLDADARLSDIIALVDRQTREDAKPDVLVVDYIQLMSGDGDSDTSRVGDISKGLTLLSKREGICSIIVAQLNRDLMKRSNPRPIMSDLKDSGKLEQDAYQIHFVHHEAYYHKAAGQVWDESCDWHPEKVEIICDKNRGGETGAVELRWVQPQFRYEEPQW